ncbi:MAG: hypothetical protein V1798_00150 [Pseudomonadota bacterium]
MPPAVSEDRPIAVRVECYAGYRGEETPRKLILGGKTFDVAEVLDRWLAPDHRYFKMRCDDGGTYIVRHDLASGEWELTLYVR